MKYKEFDWSIARERTKNPSKLQWEWENHTKEIPEEVYVKEVKKLKQFTDPKQRKKCNKYSPSTLRRQYKNLKEEYGFFTGELNK